MLNTKSIHIMFNLTRLCFLQPWSFSALFSRGFSLASIFHGRWSPETDTVSGEKTVELRPGMTLEMVFHQPSVNLQCDGDSSLWDCWQAQQVRGCGCFWSQHPGACSSQGVTLSEKEVGMLLLSPSLLCCHFWLWLPEHTLTLQEWISYSWNWNWTLSLK